MKYIERYLEYLKVVKKDSNYTVSSYKNDLMELYDFNTDYINVLYDLYINGNINDNFPCLADQEYYYLDEGTLSDMGIKNYNKEKSGYFLVKYDFSNTGVEVINTNGYNGVHTLTELNQLEEGIQEEGIS